MGFNFVAASPWEMFEDEFVFRFIKELREEIPGDIPLGKGEPDFCMLDEMGWSWWSALQAFAAAQLGEVGCTQISSVDAWAGLYIDADIDRVLIWPDGKPADSDKKELSVVVPSVPWYRRILQFFGMSRDEDVTPEFQAMMDQMVKNYGPRQGDIGAYQIDNLRQLHIELSQLAAHLGYEATREAMQHLHMSYFENDDRMDDDPEIQCLCHAWLTSQHALEHGVPMWLLK